MSARIAAAAVCFIVSIPASMAQDATGTGHVYEAYYHVNRADMDEWNRIYREVSVPILNDLVEEGVITGFDQWLHSTGGEYNIRFAVRTADWASIGEFWDEFLDRRSNVRAATGRMIRDHRDEIWDLYDISNLPSGDAETHYLYASTYQINFGDMAEWLDLWTDTTAPVLAEVRDAGLLLGWAVLEHNTGGPHNSKVVYFFEDWDDIDDAFDMLNERLEAENPAASARMSELRGRHNDIVYEPTPDN